MKSRHVGLPLLLMPVAVAMPICAAAQGSPLPVPGQDYHSLQIASSSDVGALERQFVRYAGLPFLRIERRGTLHVLRAGFWAKASEVPPVGSLPSPEGGAQPWLRIATFRPEAIVRCNWPQEAGGVRHAALHAMDDASRAPSHAGRVMPVALDVPVLSKARTVIAPVSPKTPALEENDGLHPFDAEDYALAFDAFIGSGDQESAYRIARKAVASVPNDIDWRRRLARVAEWTRRPEVALGHWEFLYRSGDRSEETLAAMLRFAPFAEKYDAALEVWGVRAERGMLTEAQWADIFDLYEFASLAPQGSRFFERQFRRSGKIRLLEYAAGLADHAGEDDRALSLYAERAALKPFSIEATLNAAIFLVRRDRMREAFRLLDAHREEVPADALDYWNMFAGIAWELSETGAAEFALRRQSEGRNPEDVDWGKLIFLIQQRHPEQAAKLAYESYLRLGDVDQLILALNILGQRGDFAAQARMFKALPAARLRQLEDRPEFLVLRALHYQHLRDPAHAWNDYSRILARHPENHEGVAAALWFLIDGQRKEELLPLLDRLTKQSPNVPAYWLAFAAAFHSLDRYREALHWYRKEMARNADPADPGAEDMLLLLNYADALDRVQLKGMAERVRRHVWLRLREKYPEPALQAPLDAQPDLLALARLAILNAPGDPGLALVRQVVNRLRGLEVAPASDGASNGVRPVDRQTRDLILGWAISREQFPDARAWMWVNYARRAQEAPPVWGDIQTALQMNDTERMDRLLGKQGDGLPIYNRYDTAHALEHWPLALDVAFRGMDHNDVDEDLHDRFRQHAPQRAQYAQVRIAGERYGELEGATRQYEVRLVPDRRLHVRLTWSQTPQKTDVNNPAVSERENLAGVEAKWLSNRGETTFGVFHRNEHAGNTGWSLGQTWALDSRLGLTGTIAQRADALESQSLRVGGYENSVKAGIHYTAGKREHVAISARLARFHTQEDDYLGSGRGLDAEAGYRFRIEYPDWRVRVFASHQGFSYGGHVGPMALRWLPPAVRSSIAGGATDAVRYFLPQGSTTWGACLGMGENLAGQNLQDVYTRAWRHFYDVCPSHNSLNGVGYSGTLGMAGSLSGEDHLSLRVEQARGGSGSGALSRVLAVRYRHYF